MRTDLALLKDLAEIVEPFALLKEIEPIHTSAVRGDWFGAIIDVNNALKNRYVRRMDEFCAELADWKQRAERLQKAA